MNSKGKRGECIYNQQRELNMESKTTLGEDVGKVSSVLFPCSTFVMSKSSQDGLKQGSLFSKIQESPEIAS